MMLLLSIIITILVMSAIVVTIWFLIDYFDDYVKFPKEYPKIKFNSFITFYNLNPKRWTLNEHTVDCNINQGKKHTHLDNQTFCFSYIDMNRYQHWCKNIEKYKQSQRYDKQTALMLAAVKEDIASIESLAKQEQSEAINILRSIHNL